jgi:hypothetical protein
MSECEYCGQENAVIEIDNHYFHRECYSNFLKENRIKKGKFSAVFLLIVISIGLGLGSLLKGFHSLIIASVVILSFLLLLFWLWHYPSSRKQKANPNPNLESE